MKDLLRSLAPRGLLLAYHRVQAMLAALVFWFPARNLRVFAVTGTKGKTTTSLFLHAILHAARRRAGLSSSVRFCDGVDVWKNELKMGTPSPWALNKLLSQMRSRRASEAVIEVTSHALDQSRIWGIPIDTAVLTNFAPEHLEYHRTKEEYRNAKERLFAAPHRVSVVNGDDAPAPHFLKYPAVRKLTFSLRPGKTSEVYEPSTSEVTEGRAAVWASGLKPTTKGTEFTLHIGEESASVQLQLLGEVNVANALAASAAAAGANVPLETIVAGLESLEVSPGRMERIDEGQGFTVIIDYAHTPDSLSAAFQAVRPLVGRGKRLIHVGGATGRRYKEKRALLGALAGRFADVVIVTDEDPYDEDPSAIMAEVITGAKKGAGRRELKHGENFFPILDRAEAIRKAVALAKPGDVVLITGKGDESVMVVGKEFVPFSDREVVKQALSA